MVLMQVPSSQDTSSDVQLTCPAARGEEGLTASKTYKSVCVCVSVDVRRLCAGAYRGQKLNHRVIQPLGSPLFCFFGVTPFSHWQAPPSEVETWQRRR